MLLCRVLVICIAALAPISTAVAQSERKAMAIRPIGPWTLAAVSNLAGDDLEYCAAKPAPLDDRRPTLVQTVGGAFAVWADKPAALKLVENQMVDLQIDRGPVLQSSIARSLSESFALMVNERAVFQALRRGSELVILTQPVLRFNLRGVAEAIDALDDCVRDRGRIAAAPTTP